MQRNQQQQPQSTPTPTPTTPPPAQPQPQPPASLGEMISKLAAIGEGAPTPDEKRQLLIALRMHSPETFDAEVVTAFHNLGTALNSTRGITKDLDGRVKLL